MREEPAFFFALGRIGEAKGDSGESAYSAKRIKFWAGDAADGPFARRNGHEAIREARVKTRATTERAWSYALIEYVAFDKRRERERSVGADFPRWGKSKCFPPDAPSLAFTIRPPEAT